MFHVSNKLRVIVELDPVTKSDNIIKQTTSNDDDRDEGENENNNNNQSITKT